MQLTEEINRKEIKLRHILRKKHVLTNRVARMREKNLDTDLLDERVRKVLGLSKKNEEVIFLNNNKNHSNGDELL